MTVITRGWPYRGRDKTRRIRTAAAAKAAVRGRFLALEADPAARRSGTFDGTTRF